MVANTRAVSRRSLMADVRRVSVPRPHYEASLPAFGLSAVGDTREQVLGRLAMMLDRLFADANR